MLAGEETGRTKYGNEDSYNSPQKLNAIRWSRRREFGELFEFYKRLIALRKRYNRQLFSYAASTDAEYSYGVFEIADYETGRFVFKRERGGAMLTVELDPSTLSGYIDIDGRRLEIWRKITVNDGGAVKGASRGELNKSNILFIAFRLCKKHSNILFECF